MKKVRRSKASVDAIGVVALPTTPGERGDGTRESADALDRRAKKRAARRKARRARERHEVARGAQPIHWENLVGGFLGGFAAKTVADIGYKIITGKESDEPLLEAAKAVAGGVRLEPVCCYSTCNPHPWTPCGKPAPYFYARHELGAELALCGEHAERVRAYRHVHDRSTP